MRFNRTPYALMVTSLTAGLVNAGDRGSCTFSISSTGGISCPAGQLDDGQIRLNGSEPRAYFTINNGEITDSQGRGCIITATPITQVQCDQGAAPSPGFGIGAGNSLTYNGSPKFYACPATDTEYNIYISPDFGQTKCFPIELTASGCAASTSSCPAAGTTTTVTEMVTQTGWQTVWQTTTAWQTTIYNVTRPPVTLTSTYTETASCPGEVSSWSSSLSTSCTTSLSSTTTEPPYSTAECHKCKYNGTSSGLSVTQTYAKTSSAGYST